MDDRLRICLWMVGGGGFGSVLGGVFGALAAAQLHARSGDTAGTRLARQIVDNFLQSAERQPSPLGRAVLIGAADGFFFLGILGLVTGALLGVSGRTVDELLLPIVLGTLLLAGGAIFFGMLAYTLTHHAAVLLYTTAGGFLGSFLAARLLGSVYGPIGLVPGMCIGLFLCRAVRRYSPRFQAPRVGKTMPKPRSDADTNITGSPSSPPNDDFFHKPDSFEER
jgi:hypothetical protein